MEVAFHKYQATGNDFILLDNRTEQYSNLSPSQIAFMCNRKFGIGADGLMLFENTSSADFKMIYFNADGNLSSMCGNGGRCMIEFAAQLGLDKSELHFEAPDGMHFGKRHDASKVCIDMRPVHEVTYNDNHIILNTGSPHFIKMVNDVNTVEVFLEGKAIQQYPSYKDVGINVNFVQRINAHTIYVRTYERGVEDETLSCGTGVTAAALALDDLNVGQHTIDVQTPGGKLQVHFFKENNQEFSSILLCGPATFVYSGQINLSSTNQ